MAKEKQTNTFADMASTEAVNTDNNSNELNLDDFANTAVGDKVKYNRPEINDTEDVIENFQVFMPDIKKDESKLSQSGKAKYWTVTCLITYSSLNNDGIQNREYLSGAKVFEQRDGTASDIQFWYNGAENQIANLWNLVAEKKGIDNNKLSPREFIAFLNTKPKIKIEGKKFKNYGTTNGEAFVVKNMVGSFL